MSVGKVKPRRYSRRGGLIDEKIKSKNKSRLLDFIKEEYGLDSFLDTDKIDVIIRDIKIGNILTEE